jgi:nitrogen fixation-related uncharacterized protein
MGWTAYILLGFLFGAAFFTAGVYALRWSIKDGQLENLDKGAESIFDAEEPLGQQTDHFPKKKKRSS